MTSILRPVTLAGVLALGACSQDPPSQTAAAAPAAATPAADARAGMAVARQPAAGTTTAGASAKSDPEPPVTTAEVARATGDHTPPQDRERVGAAVQAGRVVPSDNTQ